MTPFVLSVIFEGSVQEFGSYLLTVRNIPFARQIHFFKTKCKNSAEYRPTIQISFGLNDVIQRKVNQAFRSMKQNHNHTAVRENAAVCFA
jgi:hypothetical protein